MSPVKKNKGEENFWCINIVPESEFLQNISRVKGLQLFAFTFQERRINHIKIDSLTHCKRIKTLRCYLMPNSFV